MRSQHRHKQHSHRNGQRLNLEEAWNHITWKKVTDELGGLPSVKFHCGVLAVGALKRAIRSISPKKGRSARVVA